MVLVMSALSFLTRLPASVLGALAMGCYGLSGRKPAARPGALLLLTLRWNEKSRGLRG